jgi:hypothetical protein
MRNILSIVTLSEVLSTEGRKNVAKACCHLHAILRYENFHFVPILFAPNDK